MTLEPGIYEDVDFADYLAWDAISNSKLSMMAKSPRHFKYGFFKEPTPSMRLGSLYHCGVLEPAAFADRYAVCPDFHLDSQNCTANGASSKSKTTRFVSDRMDEFKALVEGREIVPLEWYQQSIALVRELHANDEARRILNDEGDCELSIVWDDNGILCKARIDKVAKTVGAIADFKSTADIDKFTNSIGRFGYHRQMAHYQAGWKELTGDTLTPWLIAAESAAPHCTQAAPLQDESLSLGRSDLARLMADLRECLKTDTWPGKPNPKQWIVPAWASESESVELIFAGNTIEI